MKINKTKRTQHSNFKDCKLILLDFWSCCSV